MSARAGSLRIALLYGGEPYQAYHVSDIAAALAREPGIELTILTIDPSIDGLLRRLEAGLMPPSVTHERLLIPRRVNLLRRLKVLGLLKKDVLSHAPNVRRMAMFDAVVTPTTHASALRKLLPARTKLIYCFHGAGGRGASYTDEMTAFDLILAPGQAIVDRLIAGGFASEDNAKAVGLVKLETCRRLAAAAPKLFDNGRPTVLYNSHSKRSLRSWERFARPLIAHAARTGDYNLIVAPHVKLFARRPGWSWRRWERLAVAGRVHVDLGSDASMDMRYVFASDIYVGDVSSQIYEFLVQPRPCVFLNAHGVRWEGNQDYPMWRLGEVADEPEHAVRMINRASGEHARFVREQQDQTGQRIGVDSSHSADRAATEILNYLRSTRA